MGAPDFIADKDFVPDPPSSNPPDFIPDDQFKPDAPEASAKSDDHPNAPDFIPDDKFIADEDKYTTPGQKVLTGIEGLARGVTGGLSDAVAVGMRKGASALGVPDEYLHYVAPDPQNMEGRQRINNVISTGTELVGNMALMSRLPQIGGKAISGMIQMGLISGGDEISKAMLGHGDPTEAVAAHIVGAGATGLLLGGIFGKAGSLLEKYYQGEASKEAGSKLISKVAGIGHAINNPGANAATEQEALSQLGGSGIFSPLFDTKSFQEGQKWYTENVLPKMQNTFKYGTGSLGATGVASVGGAIGSLFGPTGASAGATAGGFLGFNLGLKLGDSLAKNVVPKVSSKIAGPILTKMAASGSFEGYAKALNYGLTNTRGSQLTGKAIDSIFKIGSKEAVDFVISEHQREKLKKYIEDGGVDSEVIDEAQQQGIPTQGFAEGGKVNPLSDDSNPIARHWPEQNILLSAARGRISGYLNSIRPQPNPVKLPYDTAPKDHQKEREYDKVLDLANQPLSILKHVKDGTLLPSHMKHFTSMYPELYSHLSKKMTERMDEGRLKEEKKPPYHVRQAMSLFLGASLDSTLTPASIQAAQMVFTNQKAQNAAPVKTGAMGKVGQNSMTPDQSREARLNKN